MSKLMDTWKDAYYNFDKYVSEYHCWSYDITEETAMIIMLDDSKQEQAYKDYLSEEEYKGHDSKKQFLHVVESIANREINPASEVDE